MRAARVLLIVLALGLLALALVLVLDGRESNEPAPEPSLSVDQPALGVVLPPLDNLDPVTNRPLVDRDEVVAALDDSHARAVHLYLYWNEVQPDGPARGQTAAEYESAFLDDPSLSAKLESFTRLIAKIQAETQAQVVVTLVQKVPCWASSDPDRRSFAPLRDSDGSLRRNQYGFPVRPQVELGANQELFWSDARRRWDACNPWLAPVAPARFGDFARIAASTLADLGVHDYEIGNEPNHDPEDDVPAGESPVAKYAALFTAAASGVRGADPQATIVAGGFSGDGAGFLSDLYGRLGPRKDLFDAVAVHKYPAGPPGTCQGSLSLCTIARTREVMDDHGEAAKPIWITELGYSTCTDDERCVAAPRQADYLKREKQLLLDPKGKMHTYGVSRVFAYDLHDFGWSNEFGCGGWCDGYWSGVGLLHSDLSPKPAFGVFQELATGAKGTR